MTEGRLFSFAARLGVRHRNTEVSITYPRVRAALRQAFLLALALTLVSAAALYAHGVLRKSVPAAGATLTVVPREIRLTFSEPVEPALTSIELVGSDSITVLLGPLVAVTDSPRVVAAEIQGPLTAGRHLVAWSVLGRDGHPVRGTFRFAIAAGARGLASQVAISDLAPDAQAIVPGTPVPTAGQRSDTAPDDFRVGSPAFVATRWLMYAATLIVIGAVVFALVVLPYERRSAAGGGVLGGAFARGARGRAARVGLLAAAMLAVAVAMRFVAQLRALDAMPSHPTESAAWVLLTRTLWGWAWLLQVAAVVIVGAALALAARNRSGAWLAGAFGSALLAAAPALSGHAAAAPRFVTLAVLADALHVLAAGGWLGGLFVVLVAGVTEAMRGPDRVRWETTASLVAAFSPVALVSAALLVATGVVAAWLQLGSVAALFATTYGRALLIKLAVLITLFAFGAFNWRRVRPRLGSATGLRLLRRSAGAELLIGAVVLAVTAVLVATPTPPRGP